MKKLMIIRTGTTYDFIKQQYGDYDHCILKATGLDRSQAVIWTPYEEKALPSLEDVSGIVMTGSHAMVSQKEPWSEALAAWLRETASKRVPILGICYGHQLLGHAFGGKVDYHPDGEEMGTVKVDLTEAGKKDALLSVLPECFNAHVAHAQSVLSVPTGAKVLAESSFEPHHAFVLNDQIWGVQFHPEFNAGIIKAYIEKNRALFEKEGRDVDQMLQQVWDHDDGILLMKRFIALLD